MIQDELFHIEPTAPHGERGKPPVSVAWGKCPECTAQKVGLVRTNNHLVWRLHWYMTHGEVSIQCRASGVSLCNAPAATSDIFGNDWTQHAWRDDHGNLPSCPHEVRPWT